MKKQTILNRIFLSLFTLSSSLNLGAAPPKQIPQQISQKEFETIESYFDKDNIKELMKQIANPLTTNNLLAVNYLAECSKAFDYENSDDYTNCVLDRTVNQKYRKAFEYKILENFKNSILPGLIKNNELSFTYTSFACGFLFQDFVILNKIVRLAQSEHPGIKINIKINFIDPITDEERGEFRQFESAYKQLQTYLENKGLSVNIEFFWDVTFYLYKCEENKCYSDIIICSDYENHCANGIRKAPGFTDLILMCLKENGMYFLLDANGMLKKIIHLVQAMKFLNIKKKQATLVIKNDEYNNYFNCFKRDPNKLYTETDLPALFYGKIDPKLNMLNKTNVIYFDYNLELQPLLIHTTIH